MGIIGFIQLSSAEILQGCIKAIIQVFENIGEMKVMKVGWEEIKKFSTKFINRALLLSTKNNPQDNPQNKERLTIAISSLYNGYILTIIFSINLEGG